MPEAIPHFFRFNITSWFWKTRKCRKELKGTRSQTVTGGNGNAPKYVVSRHLGMRLQCLRWAPVGKYSCARRGVPGNRDGLEGLRGLSELKIERVKETEKWLILIPASWSGSHEGWQILPTTVWTPTLGFHRCFWFSSKQDVLLQSLGGFSGMAFQRAGKRQCCKRGKMLVYCIIKHGVCSWSLGGGL